LNDGSIKLYGGAEPVQDN